MREINDTNTAGAKKIWIFDFFASYLYLFPTIWMFLQNNPRHNVFPPTSYLKNTSVLSSRPFLFRKIYYFWQRRSKAKIFGKISPLSALAYTTQLNSVFASSDWLLKLRKAFTSEESSCRLARVFPHLSEDKITLGGWLYTCVPIIYLSVGEYSGGYFLRRLEGKTRVNMQRLGHYSQTSSHLEEDSLKPRLWITWQ